MMENIINARLKIYKLAENNKKKLKNNKELFYYNNKLISFFFFIKNSRESKVKYNFLYVIWSIL